MLNFKPDFFKNLFENLDNNSVLMQVESDGTYTPLWCSPEFCQMMEGTEDDFINAEKGGSMNTIHPDDREKVAYLFKNHVAPDGTNQLIIRKNTMQNHELYVCIHYAFIKENGIQYAYCTYFDVTSLKENQKQAEDAYEAMQNQFNAMADESLAVFRTNLTKGIIEDVRGHDLYPTDYAGAPIGPSAEIRSKNFIVPGDSERHNKVFAMENLLSRFYNGEGPASFVGYCRRHSGRLCFVRFTGTARKNPVTGDVIAFGIETEYNNQHVSEILNNKVLSKQYDMVCYIIDGNYGIVIGDEANIKKGSVFPKNKNGRFADYLENQLFPVIEGTYDEKSVIKEALSAKKIKEELLHQDSYSVDLACNIEGETFYKRFVFYCVDRDSNFYILLKSDITEVLKEQRERERSQAVYNNMMEQFNIVSEESLTMVRSDMTTGLILDIQGNDLYPCDFVGGKVSDYYQTRLDNIISERDRKRYIETFDWRKHLEQEEKGLGPAVMVAYCRRANGRKCFVRFSASASRNPVTGEIDAFGTETDYNSKIVSEVLDNKVLSKQYDMVCYIADENYGVVIGDEANIPRGSIFPHERYGNYKDYIQNQVMPVLYASEEEKNSLHEALKPERIKAELSAQDSYTVDVTCKIQGEIFNKRFMFYVVDREANFYLLLKSDTTELIREQQKQNQILTDALAQAQYASEAKTSFLSNMSHDIRTPMNAIIGFTNLALQNPNDSIKVSEYLSKIQVSSNHLLSLINNILEMSRIESGKIELDEQPCNLAEILHELNTIIVAQVESKQQELHMDALNVTDENILCDRLRLNQILLNLLSNAVKYTPSGGKISVRIAQLTKPTLNSKNENTARYQIRVKDNGIGMSPEFAEHIFETFTREKTSTVSGIQGTGLGMSITKKFVDLMGGSISVNTKPNEGTEFIVTVDFKVQDKEVLPKKIVELAGIRALVVDDDFDTCDSTTKMLSSMGMKSEWTLSGKEAVLRAKQADEMGEPYGVYIIDWRLADLNGIEVARRINETLRKDAPILLMTAYDWPAIKDEALSAGVNAFCNKPLFFSELHQALLGVIGKSQDANESEKIDSGSKENQFTGKRILLVDDMDVNREIAATVLEMHEFIVDQACDGKEAVEKIRAVQAGYYDAVLMDVQMPVMNGYEATKEIRSLDDKEKAAVPIVAMTANAFDEDRKNALEAGMNAHIAKPIDENKLLEVLSKLIL